jgi:hypothetical protein
MWAHIEGGSMGVLTRLIAAIRSDEPQRESPTETGVQLVPDWPRAVARPVVVPDPDAGFEAEAAAAAAVGVLQWTSALLVDGGHGPGGWDFVDLVGWATGDMSGVIPGMGNQNSEIAELAEAVGDALGHPVTLTADSWTFSPENKKGWWAAPLLVVYRKE